jgi:hypothetical protein
MIEVQGIANRESGLGSLFEIVLGHRATTNGVAQLLGELTPSLFALTLRRLFAKSALDFGAPPLGLRALKRLHPEGRIQCRRYGTNVVDRWEPVEKGLQHLFFRTQRHVGTFVNEGPVLEHATGRDAHEPIETGLDQENAFGAVGDPARIRIDPIAIGHDSVADQVAANAVVECLRPWVDRIPVSVGPATAQPERVPPVLGRQRSLERIPALPDAE